MRSLALTAAFALALSLWLAAAAGATPVMCTDHDANPQGITATHLFAKIDGNWVEPQNVCVGAKVEERPEPNGRIDRGLYLGVWNTVDGGFPETHLPTGTEISLGLHFPDGMALNQTFGRWRDGVVVTQGQDTVLQGRTVVWDYHSEAYFGGPGLDCSATPTTWPSTFTAYSSLNPLNADRTPDFSFQQYAGGFYESNTVGALFPKVVLDSDGKPNGLEVSVSGCGDHDPSTLEGYFNGFTPISIFRSYAMTDEMLNDLSLLQGIFEIHDLTTSNTVDARFKPVGPGGLALEPVPGVTMPSPPAGPGLIGVRTDSQFSYSEHDLVQRITPDATASLRDCRGRGGTPTDDGGKLTCAGGSTTTTVAALDAKLVAARSLKPGRAVTVSCNRACAAVATLVARGKLVASGRATSNAAGELKLGLKLTKAGRRQLAKRRALAARLTVVITGARGGRLELHRNLRLTR